MENKITIQEIPSPCWNLDLLEVPIDRTGRTVGSMADEYGIAWKEGFSFSGDVHLFKATVRDSDVFDPIRSFLYRLQRLAFKNSILLIGEPRHKAAAYYHTAESARTLACAPGDQFKRLVLAQVWKEPHLETWEKRQDKMVWFGLPYPERVAMAKEVMSWGVELDVYSREPWPIPGYKGPAKDEYEVSLKYKYRLAAENSTEYLYHSEKLFQSERSGCVTFFHGDPNLDLRHAEGSFLHLNKNNVQNREKLAAEVLTGQKEFLFGNRWEYYSYKRMVSDIFDLVKTVQKKVKGSKP